MQFDQLQNDEGAAEKTDEKHQKLEVMFHPWMCLI